MRALFRTVTGSPASSSKAKGKGRPHAEAYTVHDVASAWDSIKASLSAAAASISSAHNGAPGLNEQASTSHSGKVKASESSKATLESITRQLDIIVDSLVNEQSTLSSDDSTGPCLEHVLTKNVFPDLVRFAVLDSPSGVLGVVLRSFDNLVILLGDAFVTFAHRSLNQLLQRCITQEADNSPQPQSSQPLPANAQLRVTSIADPYEEELASLLASICSRIKTHPDLLPLFFHDKKLLRPLPTYEDDKTAPAFPGGTGPPASALLSPTPSVQHSSSQSSFSSSTSLSSITEATSQPALTPAESRRYSFLVFDYLIRSLHRNGRIGELARTGLLFIIDLAMSTAPIPAHRAYSTGPSLRNLEGLPGHARRRSACGKPQKRSRRRNEIVPSDRLALLAYIEDSDFTDVFAAGLGAAYAVLPSRLFIPIPQISPQASSHVHHLSEHNGTNGLIKIDDTSLDVAQSARHEGIAVSIDQGVAESLAHFLTILDFGVDVTRKAPKSLQAEQDDTNGSLDSDQALPNVRMQSLVRTIRSSFREVFLKNALLPSLSDASSSLADDASITAVLTYIEAIFAKAESNSPLADEALAVLFDPPAPVAYNTQSTNEGKATRAPARETLRRLLSHCLAPGASELAEDVDPQLALAMSSGLQLTALKFLHTLAARADWAVLHMLSIQSALGATAFPFSITDDQDEFVYPEDDESDADSFIYPSKAAPLDSVADAAARESARCAQATAAMQLMLDLMSGNRRAKSTQDSRHPRSPTSPNGVSLAAAAHESKRASYLLSSMNFQDYLAQADRDLQRDGSFVRGLLFTSRSTAPEHPGDTGDRGIGDLSRLSSQDASAHVQSGSGLRSPLNQGSDAESDPMIQHKLLLSSGPLSQIYGLLCTFFSNEPATNLAITQTLAALAMCPYRGLDGWLVPASKACCPLLLANELEVVSRILHETAPTSGVPAGGTVSPASKTSRTADWVRQGQTKANSPYKTDVEAMQEEQSPSILAQYASLLKASDRSHRKQIGDFDRLMRERRSNMLFIEDLADAMQVDEDGEMFTVKPTSDTSSRHWHSPLSSMPGSLASPIRSRVRSLTNRDSHSALSPYAAHMREAAAKTVIVQVPGKTTDSAHLMASLKDMQKVWSASSHTVANGADDVLETPTRSTFVTSGSQSKGTPAGKALMLLSDLGDSEESSEEDDTDLENKQEVAVNLSKYLDNLIILEESLKELIAILVVRMRVGIDNIH